MVPTKNPQDEEAGQLSIFDDPYEAALENSGPLHRAHLCLDCGQAGAIELPRYGDGIFCMIDCRDSYHLKNYNKIFHGDIPKLNIKDIERSEVIFPATNSSAEPYVATESLDPDLPAGPSPAASIVSLKRALYGHPYSPDALDCDSDFDSQCDASSDVTKTDDGGHNVHPTTLLPRSEERSV